VYTKAITVFWGCGINIKTKNLATEFEVKILEAYRPIFENDFLSKTVNKLSQLLMLWQSCGCYQAVLFLIMNMQTLEKFLTQNFVLI